MMKPQYTIALLAAVFATTFYCTSLAAQDQTQPPQSTGETQQAEPASVQPAQPSANAQPQTENRTLWIAKYDAETKAAQAVSVIQSATANTLKFSKLFDTVKTFETDASQPEGTWMLTGKEIEFSGGSAAKRALVGFGSGRSKVTMEYTLYNPEKKVVWTQRIRTKANFWVATALGAAQDQSKAMDEQGQKLVDTLARFFEQDSKASQ
jgi:hypothetical protein